MDITKAIKQLDSWGLQVEVKSNKFSVLSPKGAIIMGKLGLAEGVVTLAQQGKLPAVAMIPVASLITSAFGHASKSDNWTHDDLTVDPETKMQKDHEAHAAAQDEAAASAAGPAPLGSFFEDAVTEKVPVPVEFPHGIDIEDQKVKLIEADHMYQPVFGTSEASTYFCIGLAGPLKFAARRQGDALSIRVEGPVEMNSNRLIAAGFNEGYITKGYTSVHFHGIDDLLAQRALSAVLGGTGLEFETPIPMVAAIEGAGK